jgi:hypothetical protein
MSRLSLRFRLFLVVCMLAFASIACDNGSVNIQYSDGNLHVGSSELDKTLSVQQP